MADRNSERVVLHVTPGASNSRWVVSRESADFRREFNKKEDAEEFAKEKAQQEGLALVKSSHEGRDDGICVDIWRGSKKYSGIITHETKTFTRELTTVYF